jgi:hypothetical protein
MPAANFNRILRYLEAIDVGGGQCTRMAFYNIAGNEENLRRWEAKLCDEWCLVATSNIDGRSYYRKTELGEYLHKLLRSHDYVGGLFEELTRNRLKK